MELLYFIEQDMKEEEKNIEDYKRRLNKLPKGKLRYKYIHGKLHYYCENPLTGDKQHLGTCKNERIEILNERKLLEKAIEVCEQNLSLQKKILKKYKNHNLKILNESFPLPLRVTNTEEVRKKCGKSYVWAEENLKYNPFAEGLCHTTSFGLRVRSKSEVIIAELLYSAGISFKYELKLTLEDEHGVVRTYYPDFSILSKDGTIIYWEHFGLLSSAEYCQKTIKKLTDYNYNQIISPNNLIITMDGPNGEIDSSAIKRVINSLIPLCC